jgi:hypothetical protein
MIHKTTAVALQFFSIYLIFIALIAIPSIYTIVTRIDMMEREGSTSWLLPLLLLAATIILAAIGIGLLWKAVNSLLPKDVSVPSEPESVDLDRLFKLALSAMGLFFTLRALIGLPHQWSYFQMSRENHRIFQVTPGRVSSVIQLILGGWLIAKPRQWAGWLQKLGERYRSDRFSSSAYGRSF